MLAQLALRYERGQLAHVESLAEVERIPANYLVQILKDMRNADIILSKRGKQGGYILAKAPEAIGLIDIVSCHFFLSSNPNPICAKIPQSESHIWNCACRTGIQTPAHR